LQSLQVTKPLGSGRIGGPGFPVFTNFSIY
jgi:hypothetical protein